MKPRRRIWVTALAALAAGCAASSRNPDLGGLYDRAASHHDEHSNPVIVIPGILGLTSDAAFTDNVLYLLLEDPR